MVSKQALMNFTDISFLLQQLSALCHYPNILFYILFTEESSVTLGPNWWSFYFQRTSYHASSSTKTGSYWQRGTRAAGWLSSRLVPQIFQRGKNFQYPFQRDAASKSSLPRRGEYNVYSTFQVYQSWKSSFSVYLNCILLEPRARVRLSEEFRNWGKDKQDQVFNSIQSLTNLT